MTASLALLLGLRGTSDEAASEPVSRPRRDPLAEVDVLVVGSGPAGLAAAWEACSLGARVLVLERESRPGGAGWYAAHHFGVATRWQRTQGIPDQVELALEEWSRFTGGDPLDPWVGGLVRHSSDILEWLGGLTGQGFQGPFRDYGAGSLARLHVAHPTAALVSVLSGVICTRCHVRRLVVEGGRVVGVCLRDAQSGERGWIRARSTVLATGGFGRCQHLVLRERPALKDLRFIYECPPTSDGGGVPLLDQVGAARQNHGRLAIHLHSTLGGTPPFESVVLPEPRASVVLNLRGERVMTEEELQGYRAFEVLLAAPGRRLLAVYPCAIENYRLQGPAAMVPGGPQNVRDLVDRGLAKRFTDLREMAHHYGMPLETLRDTFERYERFVAEGRDRQFHKDPQYLKSFSEGVWYVFDLLPGVGKSFTGAALDLEARIVDEKGRPVPGLFGAGEVCGMLGTPAIGRGFSGSLTACYYTGRVAGRTAAIEAGLSGAATGLRSPACIA